jgi:2-dehydro-3-deoxyphosphogluconate aldolase/(4S)-4-hydroxy-2-oxoglutarate aldolase
MIQNGIRSILQQNPCIPVVTFDHVDQVEPTLNILVERQIHCIEITLRTDAAVDAIRLCKARAPSGFSVGVGTLVAPDQVQICQALGVDFMVSPGSSTHLIACMQQSGIAYLPGVMTPTEIIRAMSVQCHFLKLFPFNLAGGAKALDSYAKVFPELKFCPTGGIGADNYQSLLAKNNVLSVGGSWLIK